MKSDSVERDVRGIEMSASGIRKDDGCRKSPSEDDKNGYVFDTTLARLIPEVSCSCCIGCLRATESNEEART